MIALEAFREQAEGLLEGGVDAFIVETISDLEELRLAVEAVRAVSELPIVTQVTFTDDAVTYFGRTPGEVALRTSGPRRSLRRRPERSRRSSPRARVVTTVAARRR